MFDRGYTLRSKIYEDTRISNFDFWHEQTKLKVISLFHKFFYDLSTNIFDRYKKNVNSVTNYISNLYLCK